ncbi:MAG: hypothetical protein LBT68_06485 [Spirochaetales bacterium]|jgi:hypothetical protein|nr:hypothetical protein [Spirochaetales bacterium]
MENVQLLGGESRKRPELPPAEEKSGEECPEQETPEEMIRSLQSIFCKGRYLSWVFSSRK